MKAVCLVFMFLAAASATDMAAFRYLGASADGSMAAWMMYGVLDRSGYPWAEVEILSTIPYRVVARHRVLITEEGVSRSRAPDSALALAAPDLEGYGVSPEFAGLVLLDHKLTDAGVPPDTVVFSLEPHYTWYPGITYEMVLQLYPSGIEARDSSWFPEPVVPGLTISDGRSRALLFRESRAPHPYTEAYSYRIAKVIRLDPRRLLVVFNVLVPGDQGPGLLYRLIAVEFPVAWR